MPYVWTVALQHSSQLSVMSSSGCARQLSTSLSKVMAGHCRRCCCKSIRPLTFHFYLAAKQIYPPPPPLRNTINRVFTTSIGCKTLTQLQSAPLCTHGRAAMRVRVRVRVLCHPQRGRNRTTNTSVSSSLAHSALANPSSKQTRLTPSHRSWLLPNKPHLAHLQSSVTQSLSHSPTHRVL